MRLSRRAAMTMEEMEGEVERARLIVRRMEGRKTLLQYSPMEIALAKGFRSLDLMFQTLKEGWDQVHEELKEKPKVACEGLKDLPTEK
jgi:predicted  nucleic acid-binding Zn-ribbon protein